MKSHHWITLLGISLVLVAAVALYTVFNQPPPLPVPAPVLEAKPLLTPPAPKAPILWRTPISPTANTPSPLACGWLITDSNGHLLALSGKGEMRWQASYSNHVWQAATPVDEETVCAVTRKGELFLFDVTSGAVKWSKETDLSSPHPPRIEMLEQQHVIILLSQEDGTLVCVNASDGQIRWRSPATNRSDGPPVRCGSFIAYGNCDAAVHLFSLATGELKGSIPLADDEQVAGAILPLPNDKLLVGTRTGKLVLLDIPRMLCTSRTTVSDTEAFATPTLLATNRVFMPVSEGRMTFWKIEGDQLVAEEHIQLSASFDETAVRDNVFWTIANRSLHVVRLAAPSERLQFTLGDDLRAISPGCFGKAVIISDGELICVKGF